MRLITRVFNFLGRKFFQDGLQFTGMAVILVPRGDVQIMNLRNTTELHFLNDIWSVGLIKSCLKKRELTAVEVRK